MTLQTEAMRDTEDCYITAYKGKEDGLWHGIEFVNHPTPSGCRRDLPTYSDKRGWSDSETAIKEFKEMLQKVR